jgi:hypothetical protein
MRHLVLTPLLFAFSIRGRRYGPVGVPGVGSRVLFSNLQPLDIFSLVFTFCPLILLLHNSFWLASN